MDNFKDDIKSMFEIEEIDEIRFKSVEISPDKTIYFTVRESHKMMFEKLTSATLDVVAFILKINEEYYYHALNNEKYDENIVKKFVKECL